MTFDIDASELNQLAADFTNVSAHVIPKVKGVVSKGALNVKNQLVAEAGQSPHFKQLARAIGYELTADDDGIEAAIGPEKERNAAGGLLGAYWGWSRGGGGTLPDPAVALADEEPKFVENIAKVAGFIFDD